jgi:deoxyribonuclease V
LMEGRFDFYGALSELLSQVPEGRVTTAEILADALGDAAVRRAVLDAVRTGPLNEHSQRVLDGSSGALSPFTDFETDHPLTGLAENQRRLSTRVVAEDAFDSIAVVAGVDAAYSGDRAFGACVVVDEELRVVESSSVSFEAGFPYVPGFLAFREAPVAMLAARSVAGFDVLLVNGHGVAHPRGCGLACFVGIGLDAPTVGVARGLLVGEVGATQWGWAPVIYEGDVVGAELRREGASPIYVSVGHRVSLESCVDIVSRLRVGGGLPEPLRLAHLSAEEERRRASG